MINNLKNIQLELLLNRLVVKFQIFYLGAKIDNLETSGLRKIRGSSYILFLSFLVFLFFTPLGKLIVNDNLNLLLIISLILFARASI